MHTLIFLATDPAIPTQPGLVPGLTEDQITPGLLGFVVTFGIVVVMFFLIRDMVKRIRRVRYRAQIEEQRVGGTHGPEAEYLGIPLVSGEQGTPHLAPTPGVGDTDSAVNPPDGPASSPEQK